MKIAIASVIALLSGAACAQWTGGLGTIGEVYAQTAIWGATVGPGSGTATMFFDGFSRVTEADPPAPAGCPWTSAFATVYDNAHPTQTWSYPYYVAAGYSLRYDLPTHEQTGYEIRTRTSDNVQFRRELSNLTNGTYEQGDGSTPYPVATLMKGGSGG
ncbi:hypothetical protein EON81_23050 [bacterium]|nr:MAG: hypothetical protein EON81_23050 [bacterium]